MNSTRSNQDILDLLLMGLTWAQEAALQAHAPSGITGNGILSAMNALGIISDRQYQFIKSGAGQSLRDYLVPLTERVESNGRRLRVRGEVPRLLATSDKPLIAAVHTVLFQGDMIFVPKGYRLWASKVGQARALRAAAGYDPRLTCESFMAQWQVRQRQMRGFHASDRFTRS